MWGKPGFSGVLAFFDPFFDYFPNQALFTCFPLKSTFSQVLPYMPPKTRYLPYFRFFGLQDPIPDPGTRFQTPRPTSRPRSQISDPRPINLRPAIINLRPRSQISEPSPRPDHKSQTRDHRFQDPSPDLKTVTQT